MERLYWSSTEVAKVLGVKSRTTALKIMERSGLSNDFGIPGGDRHVEIEPFLRWLRCQTNRKQEIFPAPAKKKPRPRKVEGLTEDGLIPYRRSKKGA